MSLFPKILIIIRFLQKKSVPLQSIKAKNTQEMAKKKILFINQEISPYVADTELSILGRDLPKAIQELDHEIRVFMPKWGTINERRGQLHEVQRLSGMNLIIDDTDHPLIIKVASIPSSRVAVYFIDNDDYFSKRRMTTNEAGDDYPDNGERAIFFARGVLETVKKLRWVPDVIHCQGWMSAVVPLYVKTAYRDEPSYAETKVITSLLANVQQKELGQKFKQCLAFRDAKPELLTDYADNFDLFELNKMAIDYSDGVVMVQKEVNKDLLEHARKKEIPILEYNDDFAMPMEQFYEQI